MKGRALLIPVLLALGVAACGSRNNSSWSSTSTTETEPRKIVGGAPITTVPAESPEAADTSEARTSS